MTAHQTSGGFPPPEVLGKAAMVFSRQARQSSDTHALTPRIAPAQPIKGAGDGTNKSQKNVVNKKGPHTLNAQRHHSPNHI